MSICHCSNKPELQIIGHKTHGIILMDEKKIPTKQQKRWSTKTPNWMQFQIESIIKIKMQDQDSIEEAYSQLPNKKYTTSSRKFYLKNFQRSKENTTIGIGGIKNVKRGKRYRGKSIENTTRPKKQKQIKIILMH